MRLKLLCLSVLILLTSCASSRRMGRFFEEKALGTKKEADRTNVMPLFYMSGTSASLLWPFMDKDEHGFSIRPLFNKEDDEYAFLFPLSAWNPVNGDGWVGPYIWDKDFQMLLPIFYKDEKRVQFLTYYSFGKHTGLFPLFHKSGDWLCVAGIYDWEGSQYSSRHRLMFSLLSHWETQKDGDYFRYFFPFVSWKEKNEAGAVFFPLFGYKAGKSGATSGLLPIYYYNRDPNGDAGFHTLLGGHTKSGNSTTTNVTPFWWSGRSPGSSYDTLFPLFYRGEDKNSSVTWLFPWLSVNDNLSSNNFLFPIFYHGKNQKGTATWLLPWYSSNDSYGDRQCLFPLFYRDNSSYGSRSITPLHWYSSNSKRRRLHIFPFVNSVEKYGKDGEVTEKCWYSPALLPLICKTEGKDSSSTKALFGALYNSETVNNETDGSLLGFFADWSSREKGSHFRFPAIFNWDGLVGCSEDEKTSKVNILLYSHEKTKDVTRRDIFPFMTWDSGAKESGFSFLWRVFETHNRNGKKGGHVFFIPWGD